MADVVECIERQLLEVQALEAIYDGTDAFALGDESWSKRASFSMEMGSAGVQELDALRLDVTLEDGARVRFTLPIEYPLAEPARVTLEHSSLVRKELETLNHKLQERSVAMAGEQQESVLELVHEATELLHVLAEERMLAPSPDSCTSGQQVVQTVLLRIDHMNDSTTYIKKLQGWVSDLELSGQVFYKMRETPVNASSGGAKVTPKGRAENVVVLIEGEQTAAFMKLLRTAKLTTQDRREKKSSVVWEGHSPDRTSAVPPGTLVATQYGDWHELSSQWGALGLDAKGGPSFQQCFQLKPLVAGKW
jgi:hypothetical protein